MSLASNYPEPATASTTLTPFTLGSNVARVFPFQVNGNITVNQVLVQTAAACTNCYQFGIFASDGTRAWTSGAVSSTTTYAAITANMPVTMTPGQYYFAVTNNNSNSFTAGLDVTAAFPAASVPRWGTVAATSGAMPASINPAAITETVGGFPVYVVLSSSMT
jgi:hypothetical protein